MGAKFAGFPAVELALIPDIREIPDIEFDIRPVTGYMVKSGYRLSYRIPGNRKIPTIRFIHTIVK